MKLIISLALLFSASLAQASIVFSGNTPLPQELRQKITRALTQRCQIAPFTVVESQTLIRDGLDEDGVQTRFYSSLFAVVNANRQVYANINIQSANREITSLQSPLCR